MRKHLLFIVIATVVFKLIFVKIGVLYLFVGVSFAYLLGLLPWVCWEWAVNRSKKKVSPLEAFRRYAETPDYRKRLTLANEIFHSFPALPTDDDLDRSEVKNLKVKITPSSSDPKKYLVNIENAGDGPYRNIQLNLKEVLQWADGFGVDTTHMPSSMQYGDGGTVYVEKLGVKEVVRVEVSGYGTHDRYDRARIRYAKLSFDLDEKHAQPDMQAWCEVVVDLPNAKP